MIGDVYHDLETSVFDLPALCIPYISGIAFPGNLSVDSTAGGCVVYMHLTALNGPNPEQLSETTSLPLITSSGQAYGGQVVGYAANILPRLQMEGFVDTPCVQVGENYLPNVWDNKGAKYLYPELITMMIEGRANVQGTGRWERLDPLWFRDPYGRVYNSPRILDFSASYVDAVPERAQVTMTLKV